MVRERAISVVIPCYNDSEFIEATVESCLRQTQPPAEIVVVDDGSTDGMSARLDRFDDRVEYVRTANRGAAAARNTGVEHVASEYVAFLDADDRWRAEKLARQLGVFDRNSDLDLVYTDFDLVDRDGEIVGSRQSTQDGADFSKRLFVSGGAVIPSSAVVRVETFDSVGGFDESLGTGHDRDLWIRLGLAGEVRRLDEPLVKRTIRPDSLASDYTRKFEEEMKSLHKLTSQYPELKSLAARRYSRMLCNRAAYRISKGETAEARSDAIEGISTHPKRVKPFFVLLLSTLPSRLAMSTWAKLQAFNRRF